MGECKDYYLINLFSKQMAFSNNINWQSRLNGIDKLFRDGHYAMCKRIAPSFWLKLTAPLLYDQIPDRSWL